MQAREKQGAFWDEFIRKHPPFSEVQFDDVETFEHTKLKPVSITLAVSRSRHILGAEVSRMPAKGLLADKSVKKYGKRRDDRPKALRKLLRGLRPLVDDDAIFQSDQNPQYPKTLKGIFPSALHVTTPGRRGCVTGQGELKKILWDPLFSLNHTAAMLRANLNRLVRKTWCTTKTLRGLQDHLSLYLQFHNERLLTQ